LTTSFDTGANRFGALALRVTDHLQVALRESGGRSESSAAALSAIHNFLDAPSIDQLSRVLGLTSSATVRLVDGLVAEGLAIRAPGPGDARVSAVRLTPAGRHKARRIVAARAGVLADALAPLSARERAVFCTLVDKILVGLIRRPTDRGWMCRLCDTGTCGAARGEPCPLTRTALA
jgi:DNA-binding MarR family transcriptional regulator